APDEAEPPQGRERDRAPYAPRERRSQPGGHRDAPDEGGTRCAVGGEGEGREEHGPRFGRDVVRPLFRVRERERRDRNRRSRPEEACEALRLEDLSHDGEERHDQAAEEEAQSEISDHRRAFWPEGSPPSSSRAVALARRSTAASASSVAPSAATPIALPATTSPGQCSPAVMRSAFTAMVAAVAATSAEIRYARGAASAVAKRYALAAALWPLGNESQGLDPRRRGR